MFKPMSTTKIIALRKLELNLTNTVERCLKRGRVLRVENRYYYALANARNVKITVATGILLD